MKKPKYIDVLLFLYERKYSSIHYYDLRNVIFSNEIVEKYLRNRKIDGMVCKYMGKLARKDYVAAEYKVSGNYSYFVGYYIRKEGKDLLRKMNLVDK